MSEEFSATLSLPDEEASRRFGARLAPLLGPGDTVLLEGRLGAGKTHLARAIIQARLGAAGRFEEVPSPTYTLVQTYSDGAVEILHADLYRLGDASELVELGLGEAFHDGIVLVEWPDRLGLEAPKDALTLRIEPEGDGRRLMAFSPASRWSKIAAAFRSVDA